MPRRYPPEFRRKVLDLLKAGRSVAELVRDLGISDQTIYNWLRQDLIDTRHLPGISSSDQAELVAARRRIAELGNRTGRYRRADELLKEASPQKDGTRSSRLTFRTSEARYSPPTRRCSVGGVGGGGDAEQVEDLVLERAEFGFEGLHEAAVLV